MTPIGLGSKMAAFTHNIHGMLHSLYLDMGSWAVVRQKCYDVVTITTDQGVESLLIGTPSDIEELDLLPTLGRLKSREEESK